jgi:predicted NBD/HSP70 family sugar kinase
MKTGLACNFSFHELSDKNIKSLKILELIGKKGTISRTEIARITGINIVSISNYIKKYIDHRLIMEKGFAVSTGGRKPELVELDKGDSHVIGVDIGENAVSVVLSDIGFDIIAKANIPATDGLKSAVASACSLIDEVIKKSGITPADIKAIGVGSCHDDYAFICKEIKKKFDIETFIGDQPSCAAFGEKSLNKNIPAGDILYIHSDRGYGVVVKENGSRIACDESKYLCPWNEALGAISLAKNDVTRGVGTKIVEVAKGRIENINEDVIIEAAKASDEVAMSITRLIGASLGLRIAYLVNLFDPKSVVIGGGIENAGNLILEPIKKTVKKLALKDRSNKVIIMSSQLGTEAISVGAASLAAREIFLKV